VNQKHEYALEDSNKQKGIIDEIDKDLEELDAFLNDL
jgi:hypothetical protein